MGFASPPDRISFNVNVWEIVKTIPEGYVLTYGQIAKLMPIPTGTNIRTYEAFGARWVGGAMAICPDEIPWHRVVNSQGKISPRPNAETQKQLLELEGIVFDKGDRINLSVFGWNHND